MLASSNFVFLKEHDPVFQQLASTAEQAFASDPNTTLIKLRQLGEALAQDLASRAGIEFEATTTQSGYRTERTQPTPLAAGQLTQPNGKETSMYMLNHTLIGSALLGACTLAQAATVADVFNGEMLGSNQRYFESVAGIPRESFGDEHKFRVQGCNITATIGGGTVSKLRMELTPKCQADLTQFVGDYAPAPGQPLTFGAFEQSSGGGLSYSADCLSGCGNAYDPSAYGHWEGPRAVGFMEVLLEVVQVDDQAIEAASTWRDQMIQTMGEDWVMDGGFNCDNQFDPIARQAFQKVQVTAVSIGQELRSPNC